MCFKSLNFVALELHARSDTRGFVDHYKNINKILDVKVIALICGQKKGQSLSRKISPKFGFKATVGYF